MISVKIGLTKSHVSNLDKLLLPIISALEQRPVISHLETGSDKIVLANDIVIVEI
jgi:hypothetical protein